MTIDEVTDRVMQALGECYARDHGLTTGNAPDELAHWWQHGPNPEHRIVIDKRTMDDPDTHYPTLLAAWIERIHVRESVESNIP